MTHAPPLIAHVLHRLDLAGAEVLADALARRLADRFRFAFFCLDGVGPLGERLAADGYPVVHLGRRPGIDPAVARRLRHAVRDHGVALLHAHQYTPFFYAALSRAGGLGGHPPILFTEHGRHYPDRRKRRRVLANRLLLKPADRVTAVGSFIRDALIAHEAIATDRVEVIYNGIDPRPYEQADRAAARRAMGLDDNELAVLHVARFAPVKDHETSLRAFARLVEAEPRARLVLIGDGEGRAAAERQTRDLGVTERVTFLGRRDDVPALLAGGDAFVLSSLSEGVSVTLLEAMAAGVPIAATDVGGNGEVVEHGVTGLLSPRRDADALAANLLRLLRDPGLRRRLADAGRRRLRERFTQARMHEAYARRYDAMFSGAARWPAAAALP